eukprot:709415-Pyramimonas_sp.AAC.1
MGGAEWASVGGVALEGQGGAAVLQQGADEEGGLHLRGTDADARGTTTPHPAHDVRSRGPRRILQDGDIRAP